jgi:FkbM family methyltransferase
MNYFIDCGGHHGEGLKEFIGKINPDKQWKIFSFEPNKESFEILSKIKIDDLDITYINKGVWIEDCVLIFNPETVPESYGGKNDGAGSTFLELSKWNIKKDNPGAGDFNTTYLSEVIDFSRFLESLENPEKVIVKMDIEGSEYPVLRKIISDRTAKIINVLYCEFHNWAIEGETNESNRIIINDLLNSGVEVNHWG